MNVPQALGILLLGVGLGALLVWLQQTAVRRRFRQELEAQIDQAIFGGLRRQRLLNIGEYLQAFQPVVLHHQKPSRPVMVSQPPTEPGARSLHRHSDP